MKRSIVSELIIDTSSTLITQYYNKKNQQVHM